MHSISQPIRRGKNLPEMRLLKAALLGAMLLAALSACAAPPEPDAPAGQPQEITPLPSPSAAPAQVQTATAPSREMRLAATPPAGAERVPAPEEPLLGEVPQAIMSAIREDAMQRAGVGLEAILVLRAEAVVWPDGSLGCPSPGVEYLQVITPGYWVELQAGEVKYDYRADENGYLRLCENPLPVKP